MINQIEFLFDKKNSALFSLSLSFTVNYFKDNYRAFSQLGHRGLLSHCH